MMITKLKGLSNKSLIHSKRHLLCHTHIIFVHTYSHMTRQGVIEPLFTEYNLFLIIVRRSVLYKMNYFLQLSKICYYIGKSWAKTYFSILRWQSWVPNPILKSSLLLSIFNYNFDSSQTHPFLRQVIEELFNYYW